MLVEDSPMRQSAPVCLSVLRDQAHDGAYNMAFDEKFLRRQIETGDQKAILRFYRFSEPTLTVGYGMWTSLQTDDFNFSPAIPVVRRITGGGIVCHTVTDLTYALVVPLKVQPSLRKVRHSYFLIHEAMQQALQELGVSADLFKRESVVEGRSLRNDNVVSYCFDSPVPFDVMFRGQKVAGGGQKRTRGYLLHQGSIAWGILAESFPDLIESDFCRQFSSCLEEVLGHGHT